MRFAIYIIIFLLSSCGYKRKMQKSESRSDSTVQKGLDSTAVKSIFEQLKTGNLQSEKISYSPGRDTIIKIIQPSGETKFVTIQLPGQIKEIERINWEATERILNMYDSMTKSDTGSTHYTKAQSAKQSEVKAGIDWKFYLLLGLILVLGGLVVFKIK